VSPGNKYSYISDSSFSLFPCYDRNAAVICSAFPASARWWRPERDHPGGPSGFQPRLPSSLTPMQPPKITLAKTTAVRAVFIGNKVKNY
jgi:hypothetical protein